MDKVVNLLKDKDISIPKLLLKNYKKLGINETELIILIFLINSYEYNPKVIADSMDIKLPVLLEMISQLETKGIVKIELKNIFFSASSNNTFISVSERYPNSPNPALFIKTSISSFLTNAYNL